MIDAYSWRITESFAVGNRKYYKANAEHPIFDDLQNMILKEKQLDKLKDRAVEEINGLHSIILAGDLASGRDSDLIDLIFVGPLDRTTLGVWIGQAEKWMGRKLRYLHYSLKEWKEKEPEGDLLVLWKKNKK